MWFVWILFAIPLAIVTIGIIYALHRVYLKMEKESVEYEKWKEGRYNEDRN